MPTINYKGIFITVFSFKFTHRFTLKPNIIFKFRSGFVFGSGYIILSVCPIKILNKYPK